MDGLQRFDALELVPQSPSLQPQFVVHLEIHPELDGRTEVPGEPDGRAGCDPALAVHDLVDPARRHPDGGGEAASVGAGARRCSRRGGRLRGWRVRAWSSAVAPSSCAPRPGGANGHGLESGTPSA